MYTVAVPVCSQGVRTAVHLRLLSRFLCLCLLFSTPRQTGACQHVCMNVSTKAFIHCGFFLRLPEGTVLSRLEPALKLRSRSERQHAGPRSISEVQNALEGWIVCCCARRRRPLPTCRR